MKSAFVNLAVPIMQLSEPGEVPKIKIHENLTVTLWDRWTFNDVGGKLTLAELFKQLGIRYKLIPFDLMLGPKVVYSSTLMNLEGKEKLKKESMGTKLLDLLELD